MKIFDVLALYPAPEGTPLAERAVKYSDIAAEDDEEAIGNAQFRHHKLGLNSGVEFVIVGVKTVLCPTALPEPV